MKTTLFARHDRWERALVVAWTLVGVVLLLAVSGWLLGKIAPALVPFLLAIIIVYVFRGPVAFLERHGWKRGPAVAACYLLALVVTGVAAVFIVPPLIDQLKQFVDAFPRYYDRAFLLFQDLQGRFEALVVPAWLNDALKNVQESITSQSTEWSARLAKGAFSVGGGAIRFLFNGLLALIVGFWLLADMTRIRKEFVLLAGPARREEASIVAAKVSQVLGGYLRGQLIISVATAVLVAVGLSIFKVPYSLVIGILAGVLNVIPWFGPAIAAVIAGISAAFVSPWLILAAVGVVLGTQQITDMFIQPRVMSEQVDLHPLLVILSLLAGSTLFGFVGLLLAIPVAAIAKGLFVYYFEKYTDSKLASETGALFRVRPDECKDEDTEDADEDTDDTCDESTSKPDWPEEDIRS